MPLSPEQRAALEARAAGLREEVSVTRAEADFALREAAQEINDQKLIGEVERLEAEAVNARAMREVARGNGSVEDAMKIMNEVAGKSAPSEAPVESSPVAEEKAPEATKAVVLDPFGDGSMN